MKRFFISVILPLFLCCGAFGGTKKALTVFIGEYPKESGWNRIASHNDRTVILKMLQANGFDRSDVTVLEERDASCDAIVNALSALASKVKAGDQIYVHFSCHGQQITDQDGDEALVDANDRLDEAIVPYDAAIAYNWHGYKGDKHLIDDVLNSYFSEIQKALGPKGSLLVIYDACHSGDMDRNMEIDECPSFRGSFDAFKQPLQARKGTPVKKTVTWVSFSACKDFQTNFEVNVDGKMYGRLAYAVSSCFRSGMTALELMAALQKQYETLPMPVGKLQSLQCHIPDKYKNKQLFSNE